MNIHTSIQQIPTEQPRIARHSLKIQSTQINFQLRLGFRKPHTSSQSLVISKNKDCKSPHTGLTHTLTPNQITINIHVLNRKPLQGLVGGDANSICVIPKQR